MESDIWKSNLKELIINLGGCICNWSSSNTRHAMDAGISRTRCLCLSLYWTWGSENVFKCLAKRILWVNGENLKIWAHSPSLEWRFAEVLSRDHPRKIDSHGKEKWAIDHLRPIALQSEAFLEFWEKNFGGQEETIQMDQLTPCPTSPHLLDKEERQLPDG